MPDVISLLIGTQTIFFKGALRGRLKDSYVTPAPTNYNIRRNAAQSAIQHSLTDKA